MGADGFSYPGNSLFGPAHLPARDANHSPLTPVTFLRRSAHAHPRMPSVIDGDVTYTWEETSVRVRSLASALRDAGLEAGDVVSVMMPNSPAMYEAHFAVPMAGCILNALNVRLDKGTLAYILSHAGARLLICEEEFVEAMRAVIRESGNDVRLVVVASDPGSASQEGESYEQFLAGGDPEFEFPDPADETMAISVNYTSGTTGRPKGVVYSYRGAYLVAVSNIIAWGMPRHSKYLWTLPMFHCNGWCFPWSMAAVSGTSICMRKVSQESIAHSIGKYGVDYLCGAPIVLDMLVDAVAEQKPEDRRPVRFMVAAAPPPAALLQRAGELGIDVTHVYGLTETYGPSVVCEWKGEWDDLSPETRADRHARQGVPYLVQEGLRVGDPDTNEARPSDGKTMGEVLAHGNATMLGYLKDAEATRKAFAGGWFHTGDLGVMEPDGYVRLKDRSKDIIISGGENIASIDVENVLHRHPAVAVAAVVGKSDPKWGETPCAFIELKKGLAATSDEIMAYCKENLAPYMCPRHVVFEAIPRTSTGKIQKFKLREKTAQVGQE